jgi:release factor glutamine methyltransferase
MNSRCAPRPSAFPLETKTTNSLAAWLAQARSRLSTPTVSQTEASLDASLLAGYILQRPRSWVLAHPETELNSEQLTSLERLLERLSAGEPLAYLTGIREFYGLKFAVTPDVLVPRPETEILVETALDWLRSHPGMRCAVDVGTGSGCIAVTLAHAIPGLHVTAVDISPAALSIARRNAEQHGVASRVDCVQGDLLAGLSGPYDLVGANLPYIPSADAEALPVGRFEPRLALDGGPDGLDLVRRLLAQLPLRLASGGLALLEIEYRQGQAVIQLAREQLPRAAVSVAPDPSGLDRLIIIRNV